jgi:hypothetical protein
MTLDRWASLSQIVGAVGVIASLTFVGPAQHQAN